MVSTRAQRAAESSDAPAAAPAVAPQSTLNAPPKRAARGKKQVATAKEAPQKVTKAAAKRKTAAKNTPAEGASRALRGRNTQTEAPQPPPTKPAPKRTTAPRVTKKTVAPAAKEEPIKRETRGRKRAAEDTVDVAPAAAKKKRAAKSAAPQNEPLQEVQSPVPASPLKISPIRPAAAQLQAIEPLQEVHSSPPPASPLKMSPMRPPPAPMSPLKATPRRFVSSLRAIANFAATPFKSAARSPEKTEATQPLQSNGPEINTPHSPEVDMLDAPEVDLRDDSEVTTQTSTAPHSPQMVEAIQPLQFNILETDSSILSLAPMPEVTTTQTSSAPHSPEMSEAIQPTQSNIFNNDNTIPTLALMPDFTTSQMSSAPHSPEMDEVNQPLHSNIFKTDTAIPTLAPMPEIKSALRSPEKLAAKTPKKAVQWDETPQASPSYDTSSLLMPDGPLAGLRVFYDIQSNGQSQNHLFLDMLEFLGAQSVPYWTSDNMGVTHVVFKDGDSSTLAKVKASNGAIKCVTLEWAFQCEKFKEHIAETPFLVDPSKPSRVPLTPMTKATYSKLNALTTPRATKSNFFGASARKAPQSAFKVKQTTFTPARTPSMFYDENEESVLKTPASISNLSVVSLATLPSTPGDSEFDLDKPISLAKSAPTSPEDEEIRYFFTMSKSVPSTPNKYTKIRRAGLF